jgi:hypothetical protein
LHRPNYDDDDNGDDFDVSICHAGDRRNHPANDKGVDAGKKCRTIAKPLLPKIQKTQILMQRRTNSTKPLADGQAWLSLEFCRLSHLFADGHALGVASSRQSAKLQMSHQFRSQPVSVSISPVLYMADVRRRQELRATNHTSRGQRVCFSDFH